jgi:hypothetical protein
VDLPDRSEDDLAGRLNQLGGSPRPFFWELGSSWGTPDIKAGGKKKRGVDWEIMSLVDPYAEYYATPEEWRALQEEERERVEFYSLAPHEAMAILRAAFPVDGRGEDKVRATVFDPAVFPSS